MMEKTSLYSRSSQEFLKRFQERMEKEQSQLWEGEIYKYREKDWSELEEKEMEAILKSSFHREFFQKEKERFHLFRNMIPNFDETKKMDEGIQEEMLNLVDYLYCLHGYYSFWDKVLAKGLAFLRNLKTQFVKQS